MNSEQTKLYKAYKFNHGFGKFKGSLTFQINELIQHIVAHECNNHNM